MDKENALSFGKLCLRTFLLDVSNWAKCSENPNRKHTPELI